MVFLQLAHTPMNIDSNRREFYYFAIRVFYSSATFKSNDATLQQLKSTGDYRLIERDHVADSLSNYDAATGSVYSQGDYYTDYFKQILSLLDQMTDMTILRDTSYVKGIRLSTKPLPALTKDSVKMRSPSIRF